MRGRDAVLVAALVVLATSASFYVVAQSGQPPSVALALVSGPDRIAQDTAVLLALRYLRGGWPSMSFPGEPTEIRGQLMPRDQAIQLITPGVTLPDQDMQRPVWVFVVRGDVIVTSPPAPALPGVPPAPEPTPETFHQVGLYFDAVTGEMGGGASYPPGRELDVSTLPVLQVPPPDRQVPPPPTPPTYPTLAPAPTMTPAATVPAAP